MLDGKKTFIIALLMVVGAFGALYLKTIDADAFMKILASVSGMVGLREVADKLLVTKKD